MAGYHIPIPPPEWVLEAIRTRLGYFDGTLVWIDPIKRVKAGDRAGHQDRSNGCIRLSFARRGEKPMKVLAHHIVWFLFTGTWPEREIDHKDQYPGNNRFENLRVSTRKQNLWNRPGRSNTGEKGISWDKNRKAYAVQISVDGNKVFLGRFKDLDIAKQVRNKAFVGLHKEFVCLK